MKKIKNAKLILGICLLVQSLTCLVLFIVYASKKKNTAAAFGALSLAGGVAGALCLYSECKSRKENDFMCDDCDDDYFDDYELDDDDVLCNFEDEEADDGEEAKDAE